MLSHLGRNVVLSRPISLLDIKDDDNGNLKPARQLPRRGAQPPPAAAASEAGGISAVDGGGGTQADSKKREKKMESHKNKVVEMGSKSSALKGSPFVCTEDDRTLVPDRPSRHLAPRALRRLATVLLGGCLA